MATEAPAQQSMEPKGLSGKTIKVSCQKDPAGDQRVLEIDQHIADMAKIIATMLADLTDGGNAPTPDMVIPLAVAPSVMDSVVEYCTHYLNTPPPDPESKVLELSDFDKTFCEKLEKAEQLFPVILAANFLDIKPLLDMTCLFVALQIKAMPVEEMKAKYNMNRDYTPEEEEKAKAEFEELVNQAVAAASAANIKK